MGTSGSPIQCECRPVVHFVWSNILGALIMLKSLPLQPAGPAQPMDMRRRVLTYRCAPASLSGALQIGIVQVRCTTLGHRPLGLWMLQCTGCLEGSANRRR